MLKPLMKVRFVVVRLKTILVYEREILLKIMSIASGILLFNYLDNHKCYN